MDCGFRLSDDTVRGPDVVFLRQERMALADLDRYLKSGTHTIRVLDPDSETVNVYPREGAFRMLGPDDTIDAPQLLPGFSAPVRSLFE